MWTKSNLEQYQKKANIPSFFPTYTKRAWNPSTDVAAEKFYQSCVKPAGEMVIWDLIDAIQMVLGITIGEGEARPRSAYAPDFIRKQCHYQEIGGVMGSYDEDILKQSIEKVRREFRLTGLKALPLEEVPFDSTSSAGLPTLLKKGEVYPDAIAEARRLQTNQRMAPPPTVMFHRGKATDEGEEKEARYVNGFPFSMSLIEGRFFYPYQSAVIKHHTPYTGGRYDYETTGLINEIQVKSRFIVMADYSKMDASVAAKLSAAAFRMIGDSFVMTEQDKLDWERITRYFHTSPFLAPDGYIYSGRKHGVPSGSCFTQLIDSIVNAICLEYCARRLKFRITRYLVLGDDSVMGVDRPVSPEAMASVVAELGMRLNAKKTVVKPANEDVHYLGHYCHHMKMVRPVRETLVKLVTPERIRKEYTYSADPDERRKALIERLQSYEDDNPDAWWELEALVLFYQMDDETRKAWVRKSRAKGHWVGPMYYCFYNQFYGSQSNLERNELSRWKLEKRQLKLGAHRGQAMFF